MIPLSVTNCLDNGKLNDYFAYKEAAYGFIPIYLEA